MILENEKNLQLIQVSVCPQLWASSWKTYYWREHRPQQTTAWLPWLPPCHSLSPPTPLPSLQTPAGNALRRRHVNRSLLWPLISHLMIWTRSIGRISDEWARNLLLRCELLRVRAFLDVYSVYFEVPFLDLDFLTWRLLNEWSLNLLLNYEG